MLICIIIRRYTPIGYDYILQLMNDPLQFAAVKDSPSSKTGAVGTFEVDKVFIISRGCVDKLSPPQPVWAQMTSS